MRRGRLASHSVMNACDTERAKLGNYGRTQDSRVSEHTGKGQEKHKTENGRKTT